MRAQKSAVAASRAQYIGVKASIHTAAETVRAKNVSETLETRRDSTLAPNPSISTAVKTVGTAYAENAYDAALVRGMLYVALSSGAPYFEGQTGGLSSLRKERCA